MHAAALDKELLLYKIHLDAEELCSAGRDSAWWDVIDFTGVSSRSTHLWLRIYL